MSGLRLALQDCNSTPLSGCSDRLSGPLGFKIPRVRVLFLRLMVSPVLRGACRPELDGFSNASLNARSKEHDYRAIDSSSIQALDGNS